MTLGGLALAIGMLVDDATVEVENIHRNRDAGQAADRAILDGARADRRAGASWRRSSICIVFFPVVLLVGPARFLFTPLALSVVLAMLASYLLSRTLVPTLARMLMAASTHDTGAERAVAAWRRASTLARSRASSASRTPTAALLGALLHAPRASRCSSRLGVAVASARAGARRRHRLLPARSTPA